MAVHVLYRFYSATGQLLYVGITMNPPARWKKHRESKDWWHEVAGITLETYSTRDELQAAERRAIRVERPLHNIVHAPPKPDRPQIAPNPVAVTPASPKAVAQSPSTPAPDAFSIDSLFGGQRYRETCFGYVNDEQYARYAEADRAKWAAIAECQLCDNSGYRNRYVCNHIDFGSTSKWREARKRLLQVVEGGGS